MQLFGCVIFFVHLSNSCCLAAAGYSTCKIGNTDYKNYDEK